MSIEKRIDTLIVLADIDKGLYMTDSWRMLTRYDDLMKQKENDCLNTGAFIVDWLVQPGYEHENSVEDFYHVDPNIDREEIKLKINSLIDGSDFKYYDVNIIAEFKEK